MATGTGYPAALDSFTDKVDDVDDILASETNKQSSAIEAIQAKVGIASSTVKTSLDYKINRATTKGQILIHDGTTFEPLSVGTNGYALVADSTQTLGVKWAAQESGFSDPMTTRGDLMYRNSSNNTARLPVGTDDQVLSTDGTDVFWADPVVEPVTACPALTGAVTAEAIANYLAPFHDQFANCGFNVAGYTVTALENQAYKGGAIYSPTSDRLYFVPCDRAAYTAFHYIDCATGALGSIAVTAGMVNDWGGAVYSPTQDRIYLVPWGKGTTWWYIDCKTNTIGTYTGSSRMAHAGVYSPVENRIYFIPAGSASLWDYIDCSDGSVGQITGLTSGYGYRGGCYSPDQNRIYLAPDSAGGNADWHYIDCATHALVSYTHGVSAVENAYFGAVFSPTQNRIYFVPYSQAAQTNWHYIDCTTGNVVAYAHGVTAVQYAYEGGVYEPTTNRIFFVPANQGAQTNWHYLNCNTGAAVAYASGVTISGLATYSGGAYCPTLNRIYFTPYYQSDDTTWHYIQIYSAPVIARQLAAHGCFNKGI